MYTSILQIVLYFTNCFIYSDRHVSTNHVTVFREVKNRGWLDKVQINEVP